MIGGFPLSTNHIKLKFMEVNLWNFSIVRLLLCRLSLWASAVRVGKDVVAVAVALCVWGGINLLEGYGQDNPASKSQGVKQLVAGGGVALIGVTLVPLLSGLLG